MGFGHGFAIATSLAASLLRGGAGSRVGAIGKRPALPLVLYEFEACPFCRKVREALTELDLEAEIRPCPKGGARFRPEVVAQGGKAQFPYLQDPNNQRALYESGDIVRYLHSEYGAGSPPRPWLAAFAAPTGPLASLVRGARGSRVRSVRGPSAPLSLWTYEASPGGRLVREALCEMEWPYRLQSTGRGSARLAGVGAQHRPRRGPILCDEATGSTWRGAGEILQFLRNAAPRSTLAAHG